MSGDAGSFFAKAVAALHGVRLRPEIRLEEVPAPGRIAPYSLALTADVISTQDGEDELASGRFVVLHDPTAPDPWDGVWRVVTFARAALDPEMGTDPMLSDVGWSWLTDALAENGCAFTAPAGTVTTVLSQGYGSLSDNGASVDMEVRASWTPTTDDLTTHLQAWTTLLCTIAGLPPLPEGVVALPGQRR
ncbi:DUF3000 domain-containing protein [Calidifontibacter sp. DB0510]|uniref:DUF3000 domain-containing protein n=2 Tax=Metallococcus carri TaxID=1656884 RepID=A0A967B2S1_9MICO|nr:DUF3000 domain-containing protein [Metallococcus carri]NOP37664.1 DUF3000 family protein [Calidifontibacter sp. DB2511S]